MLNLRLLLKHSLQSLRSGDYLVLGLALLAIGVAFHALWLTTPAAKVQIRQGSHVVGTYSVNQQREVHIHGPLGEAIILIAEGRVRFVQSPCRNQYCVHQGWLTRAGQVALCLPNQISLALLGDKPPYDTLNY